jgi:hypothetical protein
LAIRIALVAGLFDCSVIVSVGPPLFCSPLVSNNGMMLSPIASPLAPVLLPKPHEASSEISPLPLMTPALPTPQLVPLLPARIESLTWIVEPLAKIAAPAPMLTALLVEKVLLATVPPLTL